MRNGRQTVSLKRRELPLFPLNVVLFPQMTLPLRIFEPRYVQMVEDCMGDDAQFGVVCIQHGSEVAGPALPYLVGTTARILGTERESPELLHIVTVGQERFRIRELVSGKPYMVGKVEPFPLTKLDAPEVGAIVDAQMPLLSVYLELLSQVGELEVQLQRSPESAEAIAYFVAMLLQVPLAVKQRLLGIADLPTLLQEEAALLRSDLAGLTALLQGEEAREQRSDVSFFSAN
jgi:Lon protease-like protein